MCIGVHVAVKNIIKQELLKCELPDNLLCIAHAGQLNGYHYQYVTFVEVLSSCLTISTAKGNALQCNHSRDISDLAPCNQAEASSRMMLHTAVAVQQGFKIIGLRTDDKKMK